MVQGLGFLSKKSWHTKNKANQERVWVAEQQREAEAAKTTELARQIRQEREQEELDKITGRAGTTLDRGIDWMYQGGTQQGELARHDAEKKAEEYLLGREFAGDSGEPRGDFHDDGGGIHNVVLPPQNPGAAASAAPGTAARPPPEGTAEPSVHDRNESFRLRLEDPMFAVGQKHRENQDKHDRAKALYERVVGPGAVRGGGDGTRDVARAAAAAVGGGGNKGSETDSDHSSRGRARSKKRSKKEEKKRHKKKKRSSRDERPRSDGGSDDGRYDGKPRRRRSRSRSRSRSTERQRKRVNNGSRESSSDGSRSDDNRRDSDRDGSGRRREQVRHGRYRRRDDDYDGSDRHKRRHPGPDREASKFEVQRGRREHGDSRIGRDRSKSSPERHGRTKEEPKRPEGYGLIGAPALVVDRQDLGPNTELLQRKRQERGRELRRIRETASSRTRSTEEERKRALSEMQADARKREERMGRHASHRRTDSAEEERSASRGGASFLDHITKQTHGISGGGSSSLSARVAQNRHTNQRLHDTFL